MSSGWLGRLFACLALWLAAAAWADVPVPTLTARVTDLTQTLSAAQGKALESSLQDLEARSGIQLAVLLVASTQPESIEQFSMRVVEQWKLGRKGKDDGVLLLVAKNDRKVRIEVGYGLEGTIPDAVARRVIDESITPLFKRGDFAGGIEAGVQRLAGLIEGRPAAAKAEEAQTKPPVRPELRGIPEASLGSVTDLTGTLSIDQTWAWGKELSDFYDSGRTKPAHVVVVSTAKPGTMEDLGLDILKTWRERDNLDTDRTILLLIAKDDGTAAIVSGAGLGERILPGAREKLVAAIEPQLRKGDLTGAVESGVHGIEEIIDGAIANKTTGERVIDHLATLPIWLLVAVVLVGEALRWFLGPLFGATLMAGAVGTGAWFVSGQDMGSVVVAAAVTFIVVLVGLANWLMMALDGAVGGGGGGGGSGGFSGGGGGFGGGGASGSW